MAVMASTALLAGLSAALDQDPRYEPAPGDHLASVLVPIVDVASVVFTRRTEELPRHPGEIAEVLTYRVDELMAAETQVEWRRGKGVYLGQAYEMGDHTIWGATARILGSLLEIVRRVDA